MTNRKLRIIFAVALALWAPLLSGCEGEKPRSTHTGLDESLDCPDNWVGWNFGTNPVNKNTGEYITRSGSVSATDGGAAAVVANAAIDVVVTSCGANSGTAGGNDSPELDDIRRQCAGKQSCTATVACTDTFVVTYSCGHGDANDAGVRREFTATAASGEVELTCADRSMDTVAPAGTESVCIPRYCHGKSRRNESMGCVEDLTKDRVTSNTEFGPLFITAAPRTVRSQREVFWAKTLINNGVYDVSTTVKYKGDGQTVGFGQPPKNAQITVWLADQFELRVRPTSFSSAADLDDWKTWGGPFPAFPEDRFPSPTGNYEFRCTMTKLDVSRRNWDLTGPIADNLVRVNKRVQLSKECTDPRRKQEILRRMAARFNLTAAQFKEQYVYVGTRAFMSFDMEGRTEYDPPSGLLNREVQSCTPNDPAFFYNADDNRYDMFAYYKQRWIDPLLFRSSNKNYPFYFPENGRYIEIGPEDLFLREPAITVAQFSPLPVRIPVDIGWYMANDSEDNLMSLTGRRTKLEADQLTDGEQPGPGGAWYGTNLDTFKGSLAPPNLRATIYMLPTNWDTQATSDYVKEYKDFPIVGEVKLKEALPLGSVVSADLRLRSRLKNLMFTPGSALYVSPTPTPSQPVGNVRQFELWYCLNSDKAGRENMLESRWYFTDVAANYALDWGGSSSTPAQWGIYVGNEQQAKPYSPFGDDPGRGCRFSKVSLMVTVDRVRRATQPVANFNFDGWDTDTDSGNNTMSGVNDNDNTRMCTNNDTQCTSVSRSQMAAEGEFAKTYYAIDTTTSRQDGAGGKAKGGAIAEMLGFTVLDANDPEEETNMPTTINANTPAIDLTFAPPWDALWSALNNASRGSPIEWEKGRYAGISGLGVGWGFKIPVQIGPIPGLIVITASVGASLDINFKLKFWPDNGEAYPCIGSTACYLLEDTAMSFGDAQKSCATRGGRLADLSSVAEASGVDSAAGQNDVWIGGQTGYEYTDDECDKQKYFDANSEACTAGAKTTFRWASNDAVFATALGGAAAVYEPAPPPPAEPLINGGNGVLPETQMPTPAGMVYEGTNNGNIRMEAISTERGSICRFDPAASARYLKTEVSLGVGAAAGIGMAFFVPNDEIGVGITGTINLISLSVRPTFKYTETWLLDSTGGSLGRRQLIDVSIPWQIALLEASIRAEIRFWIGSVGWNIISFDGFKAKEGKLFEYVAPSIVNP